MTRAFASFALFVALVFSGCAKQVSTGNPPNPPTPPQIKITQDVTVLRNGLPVALTALQAARTSGALTAADVANAENRILVPLAQVGKSIDAEVVTADAWPTMKGKILKIITSAGIAGASANLPPNANAILAAVIAAYNSIATTVGGPQL